MKLRRESSAENRKGCGPAHNRGGDEFAAGMMWSQTHG